MKTEKEQYLDRLIATFSRLNLLNKTIPKVHYHYTSFDSALLILKGAKMKFSNPNNFNDPFDMDLSIINLDCDIATFINYALSKEKYNRDIIETSLKKNIAENPNHIQEVALQKLRKFKDNFGLACFSEGFNNSLLWSHYAKNHTGICIGFHYRSFFDCLVYRVKYIKNKMYANYFDNEIEPLVYLTFLKSHIWKYEKEIRAVYYNMKEFPDNLIPFDKPNVLSIHFGLRTPELDKQNMLHVLKQQEYPNIEVFEMVANPDDYGFLKPKKVSF